MTAALPAPLASAAWLLPVHEAHACRYCGRHFVNSGARRKHERQSHEGARYR